MISVAEEGIMVLDRGNECVVIAVSNNEAMSEARQPTWVPAFSLQVGEKP